jgi:hypothetical protein
LIIHGWWVCNFLEKYNTTQFLFEIVWVVILGKKCILTLEVPPPLHFYGITLMQIVISSCQNGTKKKISLMVDINLMLLQSSLMIK